MGPALRPFFSYYGSKHALSSWYPRPAHRYLVEPFAGSAGYACRYPDHRVILCDEDPIVAGVWEYLIRVNPDEIMELPDRIESVEELRNRPQEARWLVGFWLGRCRSAPLITAGSWMKRQLGRHASSFWGPRIKRRIAEQVLRIRHWRIFCCSYTELLGMVEQERDQSGGHSFRRATWFVDPPYIGKAGRRYHRGSTRLDYQALAFWCRELHGQVLVCEQAGAAWLPFEPLARVPGMRGHRTEMIWTATPRAVAQLSLPMAPAPSVLEAA